MRRCWSATAAASGTPLRAVHVHHGLQSAADDWVRHCQQQCTALGIDLAVHHVRIDNTAGLGLEGAARQARRGAFAAELRDGETLALAQHQDDQAETFLLRALRGSGVDGLAAMSAHSHFGGHALWRPLLQVPRDALLDYAHQHALHWIEDPSNGDDHADRNFLRLQVLPLLRQRWPHAAAALAGSAAHCAQTRELLDEEDAELIAHLEVAPRVLSLQLLRQISPGRAARVLRAWVLGHDAAPLPATVLQQALAELLPADNDRQARVGWHDHAIQQWRDHAYLLPARLPVLPRDWQAEWDGRAPLPLPDGGQLRLQGAASAFQASLSNTLWLMLAAVVTMYLVLGMLYESAIHPVTILSTLPSATVGALLALLLTGRPLDLIAVIGIILLIGLVKKNGIMMVDFALDAERNQGMTPRDAIFQACLTRCASR
ncbi:hypothetical protein G6F31_013692 [Rhizopus arrhizus]|nr:hypothetical protein G6F31_013692 [Rhizopus arrhizus]